MKLLTLPSHPCSPIEGPEESGDNTNRLLLWMYWFREDWRRDSHRFFVEGVWKTSYFSRGWTRSNGERIPAEYILLPSKACWHVSYGFSWFEHLYSWIECRKRLSNQLSRFAWIKLELQRYLNHDMLVYLSWVVSSFNEFCYISWQLFFLFPSWSHVNRNTKRNLTRKLPSFVCLWRSTWICRRKRVKTRFRRSVVDVVLMPKLI